ncbi:MAG: tRNA threonylcarbamoyladenosine dehydratase [Muribaculaceae bacterium]|nr:tRNA threonylcarbamoyladenosine dehydratase [Muribaculaceae bacterium]
MPKRFTRTQMLFGADTMAKLAASRVAVFGMGGVGGYVVEALARSGVGAIDLVDNDVVSITNINRQIVALESTIGKPKVEVARERVLDINPQCHVTTHQLFYLPSTAGEIDLKQFDYVVDCIDTVAAKMELIRRCVASEVPILVCMGAANKLNPMAFRVADISKTNNDPLARVLRKRLRREGIKHFKCVYSEELPLEPIEEAELTSDDHRRRFSTPASNAFVPAAEGLAAAAAVINDLIAQH